MNNIFGVGTDIVDISRIKKLFNKNKKIKKRLFSDAEINYCESKKIKSPVIQKDLLQKKLLPKL